MPAANRTCRKGRISVLVSSENSGITLIELLVTLAILGLIITALYTFYITGLKSWSRSIDHMEHQQSARIAMNKIIYELRYAHEVYILDANNEILYFRTDHNGKSTLFRFRLSGRQLLFEQRTNYNTHYAYNVIALGITGLSFIIDENNTVYITIRAGNESKEVTLSGSVRPRNILSEEVEDE